MRADKEALLFVNKKKQKNFFNRCAWLGRRQSPRTRLTKVWFFFSKKEPLLFLQTFGCQHGQ